MTAKRKTNIQIIKSIMEFSDYGALSQVFVMAALDSYIQQVRRATDEECSNALINGATWKAVAKEIDEKLCQNNR